jgi:signal transduction histidine kinase
MAGVIERVEQSEKLDSQPVSPDLAPVDLTTFFDELVAEKPFLGRVQVVHGEALSVSTDGVILRSILRNLLDNALKYSPTDTPIMLAASSVTSGERAGVRLEVVNRVGEAGAPDPEKLYTKYYRSRRAQHQPGSGLGLFLVANWARTLRASIDYRLLRCENGAESVSFSLWVPS